MLVNGAPRASETIVVTEAGTIWTIPAAEFISMAGCHPDLAWTLTEELSMDLAAAEATIEVRSLVSCRSALN